MRKIFLPALFLFFFFNVNFPKIADALNTKNAVCLFEKNSSGVSKKELKEFLREANFKQVEWYKDLRENMVDIDFLILSKSSLTLEEESITLDFLKSGGGLVLFLSDGYRESFLKELGIKRYSIYGENLNIEYNKNIFKKRIEGEITSKRGVLLKTGYGGEIKQPDRGNIFPERIPVRGFNILAKSVDKEGNLLGSNIILVKHWLNPWDLNAKVPPRWLVFSGGVDLTKEDYSRLAELLSNDFVIKDIRSSLPLYHVGEDVEIILDILNPAECNKRITLLVETILDSKVVRSIYHQKGVEKGINNLSFNTGEDLEPGFYSIKCSLMNNNKIYDESYNGFLVIDESWKDKGSSLKVKDNKILLNGENEFLWGINYYESEKGELNWIWPNTYNIERDFNLMNKMGFKIVRVHYHHPKWFKDYLNLIGSDIASYFPDKSYLPDDYDLRTLDSFIYLAKMHNIIISFDLFTLVPLEMGNPKGWLSLTDRITDKEKVEKQLEFVKIVADRYKDVRGISWDLWNEPRMPDEYKEELRSWVKRIVAQFKESGDSHLITLGGNDSLFLEEHLDYTSYHTDSVLDIVSSDKPLLLQEFWLPKRLDQELEQLEELKKVIEGLKGGDYKGFMPWQFTRQSRLWDRSGPEEWDNDLGLFLREDFSLKPTAILFLNP
jgi:hypothetical protein